MMTLILKTQINLNLIFNYVTFIEKDHIIFYYLLLNDENSTGHVF